MQMNFFCTQMIQTRLFHNTLTSDLVMNEWLNLKSWADSNKLKLNTNKTKIIIFRTPNVRLSVTLRVA